MINGNEEKAKRTYPYYEDMNDIELVQTNAKRLGFIAGCEWKDEQFETEKQALIDKACEWLFANVSKHIHGDYMFLKGIMLGEFEQAMKGGEQ